MSLFDWTEAKKQLELQGSDDQKLSEFEEAAEDADYVFDILLEDLLAGDMKQIGNLDLPLLLGGYEFSEEVEEKAYFGKIVRKYGDIEVGITIDQRRWIEEIEDVLISRGQALTSKVGMFLHGKMVGFHRKTKTAPLKQ